jgi:hypothetical protein
MVCQSTGLIHPSLSRASSSHTLQQEPCSHLEQSNFSSVPSVSHPPVTASSQYIYTIIWFSLYRVESSSPQLFFTAKFLKIFNTSFPYKSSLLAQPLFSLYLFLSIEITGARDSSFTQNNKLSGHFPSFFLLSSGWYLAPDTTPSSISYRPVFLHLLSPTSLPFGFQLLEF